METFPDKKNEVNDVFERTRLIMNSALDAIVCVDRKGKITVWTPQAEKIFGWKESEILGKTLVETIIPGKYHERHTHGFNHYLSSGHGPVLNSLIEVDALDKSGREFPIELTITPIREADQEFFCAFIRDITDRKQAEEAIRTSEMRYRALIEQASDAIMITDNKGTFIDVNSSFCKIFGYNKEELIGSNVSAVIDPEQLKNDPIRFDLLTSNEPIVRERRMLTKDGIIIEVEANVKMLPDGRILAIARDITERKRAAELIVRERDLSDSIINSLPGIFYLIDENIHYLRWNKNMETVMGYSAEELSRTGPLILIAEEDRARTQEAIAVVFKDGYNSIEALGLTKHGEKIHYYLTGIRVNYENKTCMLGTGIDISALKKAENALKESEGRFRALVDNATEALVVMDVTTGKFVSVSESALKLFKMSKEDLLRIGPVNVSPEFQPDGTLSTVKAMAKIGEAVGGGKPSFEWTHIDSEGNLIPCEIWLVRLPSENQVLIRGSIIDITERKKAEKELRESEQKYKLLFESNPLPMWMFSRTDYSIIDVNEAAIRLYGYSRKEFLDMKITDLRPSEDVSSFLERAATPINGNRNLGIWNHQKKDGSIIRVEINGHDIIYQGKPVRLVLSNDVTEKIDAEEKLKQSYKEVRLLTEHLQQIREQERTNIAREIHDELGQQLTVLKMDASWLNKKLSTADAPIREKLKDLLQLLDVTVKSVRRISAELRPSLLDDLGLIAAIEWHLQEFEKRSGIRTFLEVERNDLAIPEDFKTGLYRIFQESLTNVARHAQAKEVRVNLTSAGNEIVLSIEDDGIGFDKMKASGKNTLGILGMKERTGMMGGQYRINSSPGKGTSVIVSVPSILTTKP